MKRLVILIAIAFGSSNAVANSAKAEQYGYGGYQDNSSGHGSSYDGYGQQQRGYGGYSGQSFDRGGYGGGQFSQGYGRSAPHYHSPSVHVDRVYHQDYSHWTPFRGYHSHGHVDLVPHYTPGHWHN